jgi:hypothetical protein
MIAAANKLATLVAEESARPLPFAVDAFVEAVRSRFGASVLGVIFYGSCRRSAAADSLYDLYVVIDGYRALPPYECFVGWLLPPNVYHLEITLAGTTHHAKCTVISHADFVRGTSRQWFHSYLWGRFCQPVSIAWVRDGAARAMLIGCLASAVRTFIGRVLCLVPGRFDAGTLWVEGLRTSYDTELRSEGPDRALEIYAKDAPYYDALTLAAVHDVPGLKRRASGEFEAADTTGQQALAWSIRRVTGKLLSVARVLKAWTTFKGGLDYLVWKLARHSGQAITVPARVRARPLIYVWPFLWRLYRAGAFR